MIAPKNDDLHETPRRESVPLASTTLVSRLRVPMRKYCYGRGGRKVIEEFTNWQGLWLLAVLSAVAIGTLLLYVLGYLHLDRD
jgi:hypothetical protein